MKEWRRTFRGHGRPRDFARAVISRCWRQEGTTRPRRRRGAEQTGWTGLDGIGRDWAGLGGSGAGLVGGDLLWVGGHNPVVSPERRGDGWDCCGLGAAIRWCRVAQPPATSRHPLRGAILLGVVSGGVARGLAQPPAPMKDVKQQVRLPIREGREGALRAVFSGFRGGR
jgi:hypothetical protein